MPVYLYSNPKNESEIIEVVQSMNETHEYVKNGIKWIRVFTKPRAAIDTKIDPRSEKEFNEKLSNKKETIGSLWDRSAELSEKRERQEGKDSLKERYFNRWSKRRKGRKHPKSAGGDGSYTHII